MRHHPVRPTHQPHVLAVAVLRQSLACPGCAYGSAWAHKLALTAQDKNPDNRERAAEKFKEVLVVSFFLIKVVKPDHRPLLSGTCPDLLLSSRCQRRTRCCRIRRSARCTTGSASRASRAASRQTAGPAFRGVGCTSTHARPRRSSRRCGANWLCAQAAHTTATLLDQWQTEQAWLMLLRPWRSSLAGAVHSAAGRGLQTSWAVRRLSSSHAGLGFLTATPVLRLCTCYSRNEKCYVHHKASAAGGRGGDPLSGLFGAFGGGGAHALGVQAGVRMPEGASASAKGACCGLRDTVCEGAQPGLAWPDSVT